MGQVVDLAPELVSETSSALHKRVQRIETLETAPQDFLVRQILFGATFQNTIYADAFDTMKLIVFQIGIVNHFADLLDCLVPNDELLGERFKGAIIANLREFCAEKKYKR